MLLHRLWDRRRSSAHARPEDTRAPEFLLGGRVDLEVVGELAYQDALWELSRGTVGERVRCDIVAVLVPEPDNPHDPNAIAV